VVTLLDPDELALPELAAVEPAGLPLLEPAPVEVAPDSADDPQAIHEVAPSTASPARSPDRREHRARMIGASLLMLRDSIREGNGR
jgi:hypothetical protein